jgi:hypothetical protein
MNKISALESYKVSVVLEDVSYSFIKRFFLSDPSEVSPLIYYRRLIN